MRSLISTPLRGDISLPSTHIPSNRTAEANTIDSSLVNIQGLLSQAVRLSTTRAQDLTPKIIVSADSEEGAVESTAPWSWTAADASLTEISLLPFLMNLAAAKDDVQAIAFCLSSETLVNAEQQDPELQMKRNTAIRGGVVNCIDPASGRSPLHIAALNGSIRSIEALLEAGALVHLRDNLGHTALYYVRIILFVRVGKFTRNFCRLPDKDTRMPSICSSRQVPIWEDPISREASPLSSQNELCMQAMSVP